MRLLVVTGTGTGVGKTVATSALAAAAAQAGERVAVLKPIQTGVLPGEPGDLAEIGQLTGLRTLFEFYRYAEPLAPATAARRLGQPGPSLQQLVEQIAGVAEQDRYDLVIVEGAGGVLVRFTEQGDGIAALTAALARRVSGAAIEIVLVCSAGLGSLHAAGAAALALRQAGLHPDHLVIGAWPADPGLAERCNLTDLSDYAATPLHGVIGDGAGRLAPAAFADYAVGSLTPELGGRLDAADFTRAHTAPPPRSDRHR